MRSLAAARPAGLRRPAGDNRPRLADGRPGPDWLAEPRGLRPAVAVAALRNRAQMTQSADRLVQRILDAVGDDTYVVLTSDNGFHLGQLGLSLGKGTPYSPDVRVPLLVVGPGVAARQPRRAGRPTSTSRRRSRTSPA